MNDIETQLDIIWQNEQYTDFYKRPYLYPVIEQNKDLLFVGINPSFKKEHLGHVSYTIDERVNKLPYFNAFNNFALEIKASWTHIDLLFFRETNQNKIHDILKTEAGRQFIYVQLMVADKLIRHANPKVIMVCNALARVFMGMEKDKEKHTCIWMDYEFIFDDKIGTYRWEGKPVFFSSMLSGQRALDKGSLERLQWHVKRTLQEI